EHRSVGDVDVDGFAVLATDVELALPALAPTQPAHDLRREREMIRGDQEIEHALAERLRLRPSEDPLGLAVPGRDETVAIGDDDRDAQMVEQPRVETGGHVPETPPHRAGSGRLSAPDPASHTVEQPAG